jgi:hypothetical protein
MEDGVYILITKDGYRVSYSEDNYIYLYGAFNDDTMAYNLDPVVLNEMFGKCAVFPDAKSVLEAAKYISKTVQETVNGIMFIDSYGKYTYEELLNGKANKKLGGD